MEHSGHAWLENWSLHEVSEAISRGELSSVDVVKACLERIGELDSKVNSVLEINPDALHIAEAMDQEQRLKGRRGVLHGIPVLLKDNIDTGDKMHTSAGSLALADSYAPADSCVAERLRQAGAVVLGKTNMTEWANFMAHDMPPGYSSRGGQVLNPYGQGRFHPGGSSSGSGAAVACGFVPAAIGTETSGSILSPASANSVVGIKPTVGLVSRRGIIPIMNSQDTAGPLAKTVADAAVVLAAISGVDSADPVTLAGEGMYGEDYTRLLDKNALRGSRIGVPRDGYERLNPHQVSIMDTAVQALKSEGATVLDAVPLKAITDRIDRTAMIHEFKPAINAYLSKLLPHVAVHSLKELIRYNYANAHNMLHYGQALLVLAEQTSGTLTEPEYLRSRLDDLRVCRIEGIDRVMREHSLDALLMPGSVGSWVAAKAGYPSVCVPGGYQQSGEPFGVTFTGTGYSEPVLIRLAYAFEQATQFRRPPNI